MALSWPPWVSADERVMTLDAVDRVGAPDRRAGTADHLDAFHVLHHHILGVPEDAGKQRRINAAAIDQHQQFVLEGVVEAARGDGPIARVDLGHLQIGRQPQRLG
jgi:hypothetical protein